MSDLYLPTSPATPSPLTAFHGHNRTIPRYNGLYGDSASSDGFDDTDIMTRFPHQSTDEYSEQGTPYSSNVNMDVHEASTVSRDVQSHGPIPSDSRHMRTSAYRTPSMDASLSADRIKLLKTWCDMVSNKFGLTQEQLQDLRGIVDFGAHCLQPGDIQIRIFQQAALYQTFNTVAAQKVDYTRFQTVLEDTQKRLGAKYSLTKEEVNTVITFTKDAIFQADRTSYMDVHLDVEAILCKKAESLDLLHIFKSDVKTRAIKTVIKDKSSSVRNQYRAVLFKSTKPEGTVMSLDKVAYVIAEKFKKGSPGNKLKADYQLHVCLLRAIANEFYNGRSTGVPSLLLWSDDDKENDKDQGGRPQKRARMDTADSEVPGVGAASANDKDLHFWEAVDAVFVRKLKEFGDDLHNNDWKQFLTTLVNHDFKKYGNPKASDGVEPIQLQTVMAAAAVVGRSNPGSSQSLPSMVAAHGAAAGSVPLPSLTPSASGPASTIASVLTAIH